MQFVFCDEGTAVINVIHNKYILERVRAVSSRKAALTQHPKCVRHLYALLREGAVAYYINPLTL
jgi:hypothetical protein